MAIEGSGAEADMNRRFRWNEWNEEHIGEHGVSKAEAEYVARYGGPPFPKEIGQRKFLVRGKTAEGRFLQVIYVVGNDEEIDYESLTLSDILEMTETEEPALYIIHARDLTAREKAKFRRNQ
jgi:uncharacterized DUF497 family protein